MNSTPTSSSSSFSLILPLSSFQVVSSTNLEEDRSIVAVMEEGGGDRKGKGEGEKRRTA